MRKIYTNTLKTRIKHKIGTPQEWAQATNFSPLEGELIVYSGDIPRVKIGDGSTNVEQLPFITDDFISIDLNETETEVVPKINSDQLGGVDAEFYALKTDTAPDAEKLGGLLASDYALQASMDSAVKKSGDTMTGTLTIQKTSTIAVNDPASIVFANTQTDNNVTTSVAGIFVYDDHDTKTNGQNMVIKSGGNMIIGGGESSSKCYTTDLVGSTSESTYITADSHIYFYSNANTYENKHVASFSNAGVFDAPTLSEGGVAILSKAFPIGSCYITSTNSSPASYLGGTWELIEKHFSSATIKNSYVTYNTANVTALDTYAFRSGDSITIKLGFTSLADWDDSTVEIGNLNLSVLGISSLGSTASIYAKGDGPNGAALCNINSAGVITVTDTIAADGADAINAGNLYCEFTYTVHSNYKLDEACNQFVWKRTA